MSSRRLCIVDDCRDSADSLAILFGTEGFSVEQANTGAEAIDLVRQGPFEIVICDLTLPDIDGTELVRRLRELSPAGTTYIAVSGRELSKEEARLFDKTFEKPVDFSELLSACA